MRFSPQASFRNFANNLLESLGIPTDSLKEFSEDQIARTFLGECNRYFYQAYSENGKKYISPFHRFWEEDHPTIIGASVDEQKAEQVAQELEKVFAQPQQFPKLVLQPPINRENVSDQAVANVRFFTTIQDFKIDIYKGGRNPFKQFLQRPDWFTSAELLATPDKIHEFLQWLEATSSQGDKRFGWMLAGARLLQENFQGDAYKIAQACHSDAEVIQEFLASKGDIGYSKKKADMFIRDMLDWGIWSLKSNIDKVNVASDSNTMRVALRTGILNTQLPLLASYLDVYCYQYGLIDQMTQFAWRTVWEEWGRLPRNHRPASPASMDYLLYGSIGKKLCRKTTPKCGDCIFDTVCAIDSRHLKPPKSISRKGMTGWDSGSTDSGGGGGIMS